MSSLTLAYERAKPHLLFVLACVNRLFTPSSGCFAVAHGKKLSPGVGRARNCCLTTLVFGLDPARSAVEMWTHRARIAHVTCIILTVAVVSSLLALPCSAGDAANGGDIRVSFNRGQNAADIADALDNRVEEEAVEAAEPGDAGGEEQDEQPGEPFMAQHDVPSAGDHHDPQAPPPPLHPDDPGLSDSELPVSKDSDGNGDMQPRLRHDHHPPAAHRDAGRVENSELSKKDSRETSLSSEMDDQKRLPVKGDLERRSREFPPAAQPREPEPNDMILRLRQNAKKEKGENPGPNKYRDAMENHVRELEKYIMKLNSADPDGMSEDAVRAGKSLCEDMKFELGEQKKAFEQLLKEKNLLAKTIKDEETALFALQEKVQHPELTQWIKARAARFSEHFENPETDAVAYYARRYVQPQVFKARNRISALEGRLEKTVDVVLPAKYGSFVALILALIVVVVPIFVTLSAITSITKAISMRQHVLICNLCITSFVIVLAFCGLVLQADPLKTLYNASDSGFIFLQFCLVALFMASLAMLARALYFARDDRDLIVSPLVSTPLHPFKAPTTNHEAALSLRNPALDTGFRVAACVLRPRWLQLPFSGGGTCPSGLSYRHWTHALYCVQRGKKKICLHPRHRASLRLSLKHRPLTTNPPLPFAPVRPIQDFIAMTLLTISSAMPEEIEEMGLPQPAGAGRGRGNGVGISARVAGSDTGRRATITSAVGEGIAAGSSSLSRLASSMTNNLDSKTA